MRAPPPSLAALAVAGCALATPALAAPLDGRPPPLAGVPVVLDCSATLPDDHPALLRYAGEDAHDLAVAAGLPDPSEAVSALVCEALWEVLADAGAHAAPADVQLPARAVLTARFEKLWIEGSRIVEQRVGSALMPVSIPHWALAGSFSVRFAVAWGAGRQGPERGAELRLELGGSAEQDDYASLRLGALLRGVALEAFRQLPRVLADDGQLGELLFALLAEAPPPPDELAVPELLAGLPLLLATDVRQRHDALAILLTSPRLRLDVRWEIARWFLVNDPDVGVRRDALGWLALSRDRGGVLADEYLAALGWLVLHDRSARMRGEAARQLGELPPASTRPLLLAATTDEDAGVADRASSALRKSPPPTAAELEAAPRAMPAPVLPPWTRWLDGRVAPVQPGEEALLAFALAVGSPVADDWIGRWIARGATPERPFRAEGLLRVAREASATLRPAAVRALRSVAGREDVHAHLVAVVRGEVDAALVEAALTSLVRLADPGVAELLVEASRRDDAAVRRAAVAAMVGAQGVSLDARLRLLAGEDPDRGVRRAAKRALRERSRASS